MKTVKSWKDITIKQYTELHNLQKQSEGLYEFEILLDKISIIYEISIEEAERIPFAELNQLLSECAFLFDERSSPESSASIPNEIEIEGDKYFLVDLNSITSGEWVDLKY